MTTEKSIDKKLIHTFISLAIMLFFRFIPAAAPLTSHGMAVIGIFLGVVYAWVACESAWPSFVGLVLLAVTTSAFDNVTAALQNGIVNQNILTVFATQMVAAIFAITGTGKWLGQWIVSRPVLKGRPYLMIATFFAAMWLPLNLGMAGMILIWDVFSYLNDVLGYQKKSKWLQFLCYMIMFNYMVTMYMPNTQGLITCSGLFSAYVENFDYGPNMLPFGILYSLAQILCVFLVLKFMFRISMKDLKKAEFHIEAPERATTENRIILSLLGLYIVMLVVPQYLPAGSVQVFLKQFGVIGSAFVFVILSMMIRVKGKPVTTFKQIQRVTNWSVVLLPLTAQILGTALTADSTGVVAALSNLLTPMFHGMSLFTFEMVILILAVVLTNFLTNIVVISLLLPIVFSVGPAMGMDPQQFLPLLAYAGYLALALPSANPITAFMHGQDQLVDTKQIIKFSIPSIIVCLILYAVVGIPLSQVFF